jgi:hypothetical protein
LRLLLWRFHSLNCRRKGAVDSDVIVRCGGNGFVEFFGLGKRAKTPVSANRLSGYKAEREPPWGRQLTNDLRMG